MTQANPTALDGKQMDISKCRTHMNSAGIAECMMDTRCQWALRVGHSMGLAIHSFRVCRHPSAKQVTKPVESGADSVLANQ